MNTNFYSRWIDSFGNRSRVYRFSNKLSIQSTTDRSWSYFLTTVVMQLREYYLFHRLYDMNYRLLTDPSELENGHYYVAVGTEKLKKYPYGDLHSSKTPSPRKMCVLLLVNFYCFSRDIFVKPYKPNCLSSIYSGRKIVSVHLYF